MREIKYRCWLKQFKRFHEWGFDIGSSIFIGPPSDGGSLFTHEQFTGLKDDNEKEVYEGDFIEVEIEQLFDSVKKIGIVEYSESSAAFLILFLENGVSIGFPDEFLIVGNQHETPSLLEIPG